MASGQRCLKCKTSILRRMDVLHFSLFILTKPIDSPDCHGIACISFHFHMDKDRFCQFFSPHESVPLFGVAFFAVLELPDLVVFVGEIPDQVCSFAIGSCHRRFGWWPKWFSPDRYALAAMLCSGRIPLRNSSSQSFSERA